MKVLDAMGPQICVIVTEPEILQNIVLPPFHLLYTIIHVFF